MSEKKHSNYTEYDIQEIIKLRCFNISWQEVPFLTLSGGG